MTDEMRAREKAICEVANVNDIGEVSDGFHTFNGLYEQRMILFAALVKAYKNKAWKSYRHEDGEYCFGGGWFIVGIDTPKGSYTYHYEDKYWDMFDCVDLPRGKHWDGHTEKDAETRLMSLEPEPHWIPVTENTLPETENMYRRPTKRYLCQRESGGVRQFFVGARLCDPKGYLKDWWDWYGVKIHNAEVVAYMPLPEPYRGGVTK